MGVLGALALLTNGGGTPFAPSMVEAELRRDAQSVLGRAIASG